MRLHRIDLRSQPAPDKAAGEHTDPCDTRGVNPVHHTTDSRSAEPPR